MTNTPQEAAFRLTKAQVDELVREGFRAGTAAVLRHLGATNHPESPDVYEFVAHGKVKVDVRKLEASTSHAPAPYDWFGFHRMVESPNDSWRHPNGGWVPAQFCTRCLRTDSML